MTVPRFEAVDQNGGDGGRLRAAHCAARARPGRAGRVALAVRRRRLHPAAQRVDKETISHVYTSLDPRLVLCDQDRSLRWEREQRKNHPRARCIGGILLRLNVNQSLRFTWTFERRVVMLSVKPNTWRTRYGIATIGTPANTRTNNA